MNRPSSSGMPSRASATSWAKRSGETSTKLAADGPRRTQRRSVRALRRVRTAGTGRRLRQQVLQQLARGDRRVDPEVLGQRAGDGVDLVDVEVVAGGEEVDAGDAPHR